MFFDFFFLVGILPGMRRIAVNDEGYRIGETHPNSTVADSVVTAIRDAHEFRSLGYRRLAAMFGCSRSYIQKICTYRIRGQAIAQYRRVEV